MFKLPLMFETRLLRTTIFLLAILLLPVKSFSLSVSRSSVEKAVAQTIKPLMKKYNIPGMAVGIILNGESFSYEYGLTSKATSLPVTEQTLFEIGSISKTFTAALATYAEENGNLLLTDTVGKHLPDLLNSNLGKVTLINLGTHTAGGFPLQVPDDIKNNDQLMKYFNEWKPTYAPGTYRTYANPSIGLLGMIAAKSMKKDFRELIDEKIFTPLGMKNTFYDIPKTQMERYAQGYTKNNEPIRMASGILDSEAYGIRTTVRDLMLFIKANMQLLDLNQKLQQAINSTQKKYFKIGAMTQDLIWEQYDYPVQLKDLLAGNSSKISYESNPVISTSSKVETSENILINKTGSTNGFGAYVLFIPKKKSGIILLANKNYPIDERVMAAYEIISKLQIN